MCYMYGSPWPFRIEGKVKTSRKGWNYGMVENDRVVALCGRNRNRPLELCRLFAFRQAHWMLDRFFPLQRNAGDPFSRGQGGGEGLLQEIRPGHRLGMDARPRDFHRSLYFGHPFWPVSICLDSDEMG